MMMESEASIQIESVFKLDTHAAASNSLAEEESGCGIQFSPPLYLQRYRLAVDYLTKHEVENVVDLGCSECGFFPMLSTVPSLQDIALVDVDKELLVKRARVISPDLRDYVHRRRNPLKVAMYAGSAGEFDGRMAMYSAVTMIEVIEHLHPDVLVAVTDNVFGRLCPEHVVVTTPNSEFNILFGNEDPTAFRHWDHKFEWTRSEFQDWCESVCARFGYSVEFSGVGFGPSCSPSEDSPDLGPCSQAAFFQHIQHDDQNENNNQQRVSESGDSNIEIYELIAETEFPYEDSQMSVEERLDLEIMYTLRQIAFLKMKLSDGLEGEECCDESDSISVKVDLIANKSGLKDWASPNQVREFLKQKLFDISDDGETVTVDVTQLLDSPEEDEREEEEEEYEEAIGGEGYCINYCTCNHNDDNTDTLEVEKVDGHRNHHSPIGNVVVDSTTSHSDVQANVPESMKKASPHKGVNPSTAPPSTSAVAAPVSHQCENDWDLSDEYINKGSTTCFT